MEAVDAPVRSYLDAVAETTAGDPAGLVSLVVFGSAASGGYRRSVSDVDLIVVVSDRADQAARRRIRDGVEGIEAAHGLRRPERRRASERLLDRLTANVRSFFVCTRADLLSGDPARVLGLPPAQALFVDAVVLPSIVNAATTAWGEDLLAQVPLRPVRRHDILLAWFALTGQALLCLTLYPTTPDSTKYAMNVLKRSLHNCHCCYHGAPGPLETEVAFFQRRLPRLRTLERLLALRRDYRPSLGFVIATLWAMARLHWVTALDNGFPRDLKRPPAPAAGPAAG